MNTWAENRPTYDELLAKLEKVNADYEELLQDSDVLTKWVREELPKIRALMKCQKDEIDQLQQEVKVARVDLDTFAKSVTRKWSFIAKLMGKNPRQMHENFSALLSRGTLPDNDADMLRVITAAMPDDIRQDMEKVTAAAQAIGRKEQARLAVAAKLRNDPVQAAKTEATKLWQERRAGQHPRLRTNEQFATEVMRRWPVLTSSKVVCGWCTDWEKEAKANGTPVS